MIAFAIGGLTAGDSITSGALLSVGWVVAIIGIATTRMPIFSKIGAAIASTIFFTVLFIFFLWRHPLDEQRTTVVANNSSGGQVVGTINNSGIIYNASVVINQQPIITQLHSSEYFREKQSPFAEIKLGCLNIYPAIETFLAGKETSFLTMINKSGISFSPITLQVENDHLFVGVKLFSPKSGQIFSLDHDEFTILAPDWDENHTDRAIEVVNENGVPVFQVIRRNEMSVAVRGFVQLFHVVIFFGPRGEFGTLGDDSDAFTPDPNFLPSGMALIEDSSGFADMRVWLDESRY